MSDLENLLTDLRRHSPGARMTTQRRLVIEALLEDAGGHHTVEDITAAVAARGVALDQSTVYRILQWLKDTGTVSQTDLGTGSDVYALVIGGAPHHHLICLHCGAIFDVDDAVFAGLREALERVYHFHPRIEHFAVFGSCQACGLRSAPEAGKPDHQAP